MKEEIPSVVLDAGGVKGRFLEERLYSGSLKDAGTRRGSLYSSCFSKSKYIRRDLIG